jgi:hypothetical protein
LLILRAETKKLACSFKGVFTSDAEKLLLAKQSAGAGELQSAPSTWFVLTMVN